MSKIYFLYVKTNDVQDNKFSKPADIDKQINDSGLSELFTSVDRTTGGLIGSRRVEECSIFVRPHFVYRKISG